MTDDDQLVALLAQRDPRALELLYDRYGRLAYTLALRVVGDEGTAEDVVQEAFLSIWRGSASFAAGRGSLRTWVVTIVRNRAVDQLRGRHAHRRSEVPLDAALGLTSVADTWDGVAERLGRDEMRRALAELTPDQQRTLELAYYGGYSQTEISTLMKVPLGTVKGRCRQALVKLRDTLNGGGEERTA